MSTSALDLYGIIFGSTNQPQIGYIGHAGVPWDTVQDLGPPWPLASLQRIFEVSTRIDREKGLYWESVFCKSSTGDCGVKSGPLRSLKVISGPETQWHGLIRPDQRLVHVVLKASVRW